MKSKSGYLDGACYTNLSWAGLRRRLLPVLLILSVLLQGCFFDRLITLRSQACAVDEHFGIKLDRNIEIEFYDPVLLEKDMRLIWGAAPTTISSTDTGLTMHYLFQRVPGSVDNGKAPMLEEFDLEFDFIPVDGQLRLSKVSSSELPGELLSAAASVNLTGLDEITEFACQVEVNPFTRSMLLPLDRKWFDELPSQDELITLVGTPNSTLDEGSGLVYKYRLKGSADEKHIAKLVVWYDETGEKPLAVEADFSRYQMHTNLLTAQMKVKFRI